MAACLVTISGTSGLLKLNYTISSVAYSIETGIGTLYIESTATGVTYTTLSGNVTAASGCLTITALPATCNLLMWKGITAPGYIADAIVVGTETNIITNVNWPYTGLALVDAINNLAYDKVKVIGYKNNYSSTDDSYYILRVLGTDIPQLRVRNADSTGYIYIHAALLASCTLPSDYIPITPCYSTLPTTTTTTATPTTTTTTIASVCDFYTVNISEKDLSNAVGNTTTSYNNKVYIVYTNCSGALITNTYTTAGLQTSICVKAGVLPSYYYYQNNIQTSGLTTVTLSGVC